jgi:hypothetical protein
VPHERATQALGQAKPREQDVSKNHGLKRRQTSKNFRKPPKTCSHFCSQKPF